jgi:hypothetical protein
MDGTMISAGILINGETYASKLPAEQRIIYSIVNSFISSVANISAPMDYISSEDEAAIIAHARKGSQEWEREQREQIIEIDTALYELREVRYALEKSIAVHKQLITETRELKSLHQQEQAKIVELINMNKEILDKTGSLIDLHNQSLETYGELIDVYENLDQVNRNVVSLNNHLFNLEMEPFEPGAVFNTLEHLVSGRESNVQTKTGTGIEIAMALIGYDLPMDARDINNDFQQWEWAYGHAGQTALDVVSVAPLVGVLKKLFKGSRKVPTQTVTSNKGTIIDVTPSANHTTTTSIPHPAKGIPNSTVDILDKTTGEIKTRRFYGPDGRAVRDVDYTNHGNPKKHPEWPHENYFKWNDDGTFER